MTYIDTFTSATRTPFGALTRVVPEPIYAPFNAAPGATTAPPIDPLYQDHLTSLTNKYTELSQFVAQLPPAVRESLIGYDAQRVAQGAPPLTRQQTVLAAQTAAQNTPATPAPRPNPLNIFGNFRSDLGTILSSLPRIPLAMFHEVTDLPKFDQKVREAQEAGASPLSAILQAPGVRLIPGTYTLANVLNGTAGIREAISHPLFTGLDLLPAANAAAKTTTTGRLLTEAAEQAGRRPRALTGLLTNRAVRDELTGAPTLARNRVGRAVDFVREETRPGQALDAAFGRTNREVMRMRGRLETRYKALVEGSAVPADQLEAFMPRIAETFQRHADAHPELIDESPAGEAWRAQAAQDFARGNTAAYDPAFVGDYRALVDDIGKEAVTRDVLGQYGGEFYPTAIVKKLNAREAAVNTTRRVMNLRNEYLSPGTAKTGPLTTDDLRSMVDDAFTDPGHSGRSKSARAVMQVFDAYALPTEGIRSKLAALHRSRGAWPEVRQAFVDVLDQADAAGTGLTPRRSVTDIVNVLKGITDDRQVTLLETAVARGLRNQATKALKNLYERKPPRFPEAEWPAFREDIRSASRRMEFDAKVGSKATEKRLAQQAKSLDDVIAANPPARFDALLGDEVNQRLATEATARAATPDEAAAIVTAIQERRWQTAFPDMDAVERDAYLRTVQNEVRQTWRDLRDAGADPLFVHKVSPSRAATAQAGNIGPIPVTISQGKERALDLSPTVDDLQLSLTGQAGELLQDVYRERFANQIIEAVGKPEAQLREDFAEFARQRAAIDPSLGFEGHLEQIMKRRYRKFDPDEKGFSWGGARLDKFKQEDWWIPVSVHENLKRLVKPPSIVAQALAPATNIFRYNVIGLSPSVIVNNFFSNSVAMLAESGPGPFRYWSQAKEWLKDPSLIPNEELKAMILAENPAMPTLNRGAWLKSRNGQKFFMGEQAGRVFTESAAADALAKGKSALDGIVDKSLHLQRLGDNIYRGMVYMDEYDKLLRKGKSAEAAAAGAVEQVRRVLVDYNSFTPIERQAIRTIIPFYSYMGHAMRFVGRYPLDHPLRASITAKLADAERERLGALPESFLAMLPVSAVGKDGKQTMIPLRPFEPFGDVSDMFSVAGWLSSVNPLITTVLETAGMKQGQADPFPTLRYDPETGRMRPVQGGLFTNLLENVVPRAGLLTAAVGLNPTQNELVANDPAAANRRLLSMAGIPTAFRRVDVPEEQMRAEVARQQSANDVRNEAVRSGQWREALRYPSLNAYYQQVLALESAQIADLTPDSPESIAADLRTLIGV